MSKSPAPKSTDNQQLYALIADYEARLEALERRRRWLVRADRRLKEARETLRQALCSDELRGMRIVHKENVYEVIHKADGKDFYRIPAATARIHNVYEE